MTAKRFREALALLGWTHDQAAEVLGVSSRQRVGDWARGDRAVPPYIVAHVEFRVLDHEAAAGCEEVTRGR